VRKISITVNTTRSATALRERIDLPTTESGVSLTVPENANGDCDMLILSRNPGESLILETSYGPIQVTLTYIDEDRWQGKIGIDAPDSVKVLREELLDET
jgi:carbon storage regulator CsrA